MTVVLQGREPWIDVKGIPDVVSSDMKKFAGRQIERAIDLETWYFLEGSPANEEGTGVVFYLAAFLDGPSQKRVAALRTELGLGDVNITSHVSLAGVAPADGDFAAFRKRYCRNQPMRWDLLPDPYPRLTHQTEAEGTQ